MKKKDNVLREVFGTLKFKKSVEEMMRETDELLYDDKDWAKEDLIVKKRINDIKKGKIKDRSEKYFNNHLKKEELRLISVYETLIF